SREVKYSIGLGLAYCKKIAQLHKGDIRVESNLNAGSTFYFTLSK
ncbi:MAG: signal transduction histidine kinase, partial [Luteibaculaceae bacterium]